jgi:hypothetical protein
MYWRWPQDWLARTCLSHIARNGIFSPSSHISRKKNFPFSSVLAEEELQTNIAQQDRFDLPTGEEITQIGKKAEDLDTVQMRIKENLNTLANFKERRDPERSRSEYMDLLQKVRECIRMGRCDVTRLGQGDDENMMPAPVVSSTVPVMIPHSCNAIDCPLP